MERQFKLGTGTVSYEEAHWVYHLPRHQVTVEQLDELNPLKERDALFFHCSDIHMDEKGLSLYYTPEKGYIPLSQISSHHVLERLAVAESLLEIYKIVNTNYTTLIDPDNIFFNKAGKAKYFYRGWRTLLPADASNEDELLFLMKCLFISIFSDHEFQELRASQLQLNGNESAFVHEIALARTIDELSILCTKEREKEHKRLISRRNKRPSQRPATVFALGGLLVGLLVGIGLMYFLQVLPAQSTATVALKQMDKKGDAVQETEAKLSQAEALLEGYRLARENESSEAVAAFESLKTLNEQDQKTLVEQYMALGDPESLLKAAKLDPSEQVTIVGKLVAMQTDEAKEAIKDMPSEEPSVQLEQAWLNQDYEQVLALYKEAGSKRASELAIESDLKLDHYTEAYAMAKGLKDKAIQLKVEEAYLKYTKADDSLSTKEKKAKVKSIEKTIKGLKD
ncbi:putative membrane protein YukC [Pullulanibacillus pueri]|uniref:Type VII secretion protein EssB n=1 Tax=Pullulanibacillus pueri TaxID=1437324 RepID=A0A8J3EKK6_9BACL|nr:type VII secretion protein EssB/YukC [Pullulanibacillus pueri]MBM7681330.1 putative membrane protein YukC [Pullulanibacillus pueri]GGH77563.1 hypothetical protein GCM10007096_09640 [Pullulanibacillus pueri]